MKRKCNFYIPISVSGYWYPPVVHEGNLVLPAYFFLAPRTVMPNWASATSLWGGGGNGHPHPHFYLR